MLLIELFLYLKCLSIVLEIGFIHTYLCSSFLPCIAYSGTSPIDDFSLYAPGPGTFNFLFTCPSRVLDPKPYLGDYFF